MKNIDKLLRVRLYARWLLSILFSLKHMACHVFAREISNWIKYLSHNVFQCIRIKPHRLD